MNTLSPYRIPYDALTFDWKHTDSVYVVLTPTKLILKHPNYNVSYRKLHGQPDPNLDSISFKKVQKLDLRRLHVSLYPLELKPKSYWKKKYPLRSEK